MRNNGSDSRSFQESLTGKRFKSEDNPITKPVTHAKTYEELNKKYIADGFNQYTLQYLKRMSNSGKSIFLYYNSSWVSTFKSILCLALCMQIAAYE